LTELVEFSHAKATNLAGELVDVLSLTGRRSLRAVGGLRVAVAIAVRPGTVGVRRLSCASWAVDFA
jgi:hypothetical protein